MDIKDILTAIGIPIAAGAVGYGRLNQKVDDIGKDVENKANKDVVDVQYNAILERLDRMESKMDRRRNGDN